MLNKTDSGCGAARGGRFLMPYPVYWTMSVNDWYWASGDTARFLALASDVAAILDDAATFSAAGLRVGFFGWDDRIGNGFCGTCNTEAQLAFAALVVRACADFGRALQP